MRRIRIGIAVGLALSLLALLSLMACTTANKIMCPQAQIVSVTETDHSYIVVLVDDCQNRTVVIAK